MAIKVVYLPGGPVEPELARSILSAIDAELVVAQCARDDDEGIVAAAADADAILAAGARFSADVLSRLPRCRLISTWAGSIDWTDLAAATDHNIVVSYGSDESTIEVAEHGMAFMLALGRRLFFWDGLTRETEARRDLHDHVGFIERARPMPRLAGLTAGSIGLGRSGMALAVRARAFGMRFLACDPYLPPGTGAELGVELTTMDRVLAESDFVHLHVPVTPETRHIISRDQLAAMKPTAYLINATARAGVIDEAALYDALTSGKIAGAGLDNLEIPEVGVNPLLGVANVILSPHISHISDEAYAATKRRVPEDVVRFFSGQWPALIANPEVKARVALPEPVLPAAAR